jgi:hypothetical protein
MLFIYKKQKYYRCGYFTEQKNVQAVSEFIIYMFTYTYYLYLFLMK